MPKDIRNYCYQCARDIRNAGIQIYRTPSEIKTECDKCPRPGFEYEIRGDPHETRQERRPPRIL